MGFFTDPAGGCLLAALPFTPPLNEDNREPSEPAELRLDLALAISGILLAGLDALDGLVILAPEDIPAAGTAFGESGEVEDNFVNAFPEAFLLES